LEGVEICKSLVSTSGDENYSSMELIPYFGEEPKESWPWLVHPIAVIEGTELPESVSSDWIVERVKSLLSCGAVI
jgi:hypothetical protein